jgi:predicted Zn-dependent protease
MKHYLVNVNNQELGPLSETEVVELISRGYIPPISRCKVVGEEIWYSIKEFEVFEKELKKLDITWDENTIIGKLKELDSQKIKFEQKDKTQKTLEQKPQILAKDNSLLKKTQEIDLDKTIISPKTLKYLEEEKLKLAEQKKLAEKKEEVAPPPMPPVRKSSDKTAIINRQEYLPEVMSEIENKAEQNWQEILKEKLPKVAKKKKQGSIALIILVLLFLFIMMPDEEEVKVDVSNVNENYVIPVFEFPHPFEEMDEELSKEQYADAKEKLKNFSFEELIEVAPIIKSSYENNEKNKDALYLLTLTYSLMIAHAKDKTDAANTVFKLLQLIGEGQEFQNLDVLTAKCYFMLYLGKYKAVKLLMDKYKTINKKVTPLLYAAYLKSLIEVGDLVNAKKVTQQLEQLKNINPHVYSAILDFYRVNSSETEYWKVFEKAITVHQKSVQVLLHGAYYFVKIQDKDRAEEILDRIKSLNFEKSRHYYALYLSYLGELLALKKKPSQAAVVLTEAMQIEENKELRIRLAGLKANAKDEKINVLIRESKSVNYINESQKYLESYQWDLALTKAIKASEVYSKYYPAILNLAKVQSRLGYYGLAIKNLEQYRKENPNNMDLLMELLKVYTDAYKLNAAGDIVALLSQTEMVNSEYFSRTMADYYEKKGERLKSILWMQQAIKINPLGDVNLYGLAKHYIKNNNLDLARNLLNLAMNIDPANVRYRSVYADVLYELNGVETAAGYLRSVLKDIPDDPILLNKIAILYYRSGQIKNYDELIKQLNRLPDGANDLNQYMMESSQREGRWDDFIFYANEYLKNDPGDLNVRIALAEVYYLKNDFKVAREHLGLAKQRLSTFPKINYYEARILLVEGKKDEALAAALVEAKENPNLEMAHVLVGDIHLFKEELNEADRSYRAAQRINQKSIDALKGIAAIKVKKNEIPVAIELYNRAVTWKPDDASLHLILADLYRQMGQTQDAVRSYKNFLEIEPESPDKAKIDEYLKSVE